MIFSAHFQLYPETGANRLPSYGRAAKSTVDFRPERHIGGSFTQRPQAPTTLCYLRLPAATAMGLLSVASVAGRPSPGRAALNELWAPALTIHDVPHHGMCVKRRALPQPVQLEDVPDTDGVIEALVTPRPAGLDDTGSRRADPGY